MFGAQELIPADRHGLHQGEELSIFFQVYNPGLDQAGKPNIVMEYEFHKKEGEAEKFFNKTNPQTVSAANLPPQFDPAKFPVPGGITVPLAELRRGPVSPGHQDQRQGVGQGPDTRRELYGQSIVNCRQSRTAPDSARGRPSDNNLWAIVVA